MADISKNPFLLLLLLLPIASFFEVISAKDIMSFIESDITVLDIATVAFSLFLIFKKREKHAPEERIVRKD
ncbi:MAG: hypothetical protein V4665_04050 [Patescibacteria group bacterium]